MTRRPAQDAGLDTGRNPAPSFSEGNRAWKGAGARFVKNIWVVGAFYLSGSPCALPHVGPEGTGEALFDVVVNARRPSRWVGKKEKSHAHE